MRSLSFAGLHRIVHVVAEHTDGLRTSELDMLIRAYRLYITRHDSSPARTTLYHCRNTLIHLGILRRQGPKLLTDSLNPVVRKMLDEPAPSPGSELSQTAREAFAELVIENADCKNAFFDLFMPDDRSYDLTRFRTQGCSVDWSWGKRELNRGEATLHSVQGLGKLTLNDPSSINAVLFGVRYWARNELQLIDEFYREGRGSVMYPILLQNAEQLLSATMHDILDLCDPTQEWTTLSTQDLALLCCERRKRPVGTLFSALRLLARRYWRHLILIPTTRNVATPTARPGWREDFELRGRFKDEHGRFISHVRIHRAIREKVNE